MFPLEKGHDGLAYHSPTVTMSMDRARAYCKSIPGFRLAIFRTAQQVEDGIRMAQKAYNNQGNSVTLTVNFSTSPLVYTPLLHTIPPLSAERYLSHSSTSLGQLTTVPSTNIRRTFITLILHLLRMTYPFIISSTILAFPACLCRTFPWLTHSWLGQPIFITRPYQSAPICCTILPYCVYCSFLDTIYTWS